MPARQHKPVRVGMLRPTVIVPQPSVFRADEVRSDGIRGVGQRASEMASLSVIAQNREGHRCQESDILYFVFVVIRQRYIAFVGLAGQRYVANCGCGTSIWSWHYSRLPG